jgi:hypothetical protein
LWQPKFKTEDEIGILLAGKQITARIRLASQDTLDDLIAVGRTLPSLQVVTVEHGYEAVFSRLYRFRHFRHGWGMKKDHCQNHQARHRRCAKSKQSNHSR